MGAAQSSTPPSRQTRITVPPPQPPLVLDIRSPMEYERCRVPGAVLVPTPMPPVDRDLLRQSLAKAIVGVDRQRDILVYCKKGIRASIAQKLLEEMGYENVGLLGGIDTPPLNTILECAMRQR